MASGHGSVTGMGPITPEMAAWLEQKRQELSDAYAQDKGGQEDADRRALLMQFAQSYVNQKPTPVAPRQVNDARSKFGTEIGLEQMAAAPGLATMKTQMEQDRERAKLEEAAKLKTAEEERQRTFQAGEHEKDRALRQTEGAEARKSREQLAREMAALRADQQREATDLKRQKVEMLSDPQVKAVSEYDKGTDLLNWILAEKKAINTGPAAEKKNSLAQFVGADDPRVSAFRAMVGDNLAMYIRSLSGAAVSDRERAFLIRNMPKFSDNDAVFEAKAKKVQERLKKLRTIELENFRRQGKNVSEFTGGMATSAGESPSGAPATSDPLGIR